MVEHARSCWGHIEQALIDIVGCHCHPTNAKQSKVEEQEEEFGEDLCFVQSGVVIFSDDATMHGLLLDGHTLGCAECHCMTLTFLSVLGNPHLRACSVCRPQLSQALTRHNESVTVL